MKFWLTSIPLYLIPLALGFGLPGLVIWRRDPLSWLDMGVYALAVVMLVVASFAFCMIVGRLCFPKYWWLGQVEGKDVFEYEGVYFMGLRLSRIPNRLQRIVFGVDDQMRNWDLVFGVMVLVMMVPHTLGFLTVHRMMDEKFPNPAKFPESLHYSLLSSLPVMKEWGGRWNEGVRLLARVDKELEELGQLPAPGNEQRFRVAQLHLLKSFVPRNRTGDPFFTSPGEELYFNRGEGGRAVENLRLLLDQPELQRAGWTGGALALIGFFHLSDRNFAAADEFLRKAIATWGDAEESGISLYQVLLMAAQTALQRGDEDQAIDHLEVILLNDRLPNAAYALAMEHYGEALRLKREPDKALELFTKSMELYKLDQDRSGLARVHLRLAALALDSGKPKDASHELSIASSLAHGLNDGFTLNMIQQLALAFPG